jgi:prepilin signal peptidase PulO-like enzyme (type II secretory pathway)
MKILSEHLRISCRPTAILMEIKLDIYDLMSGAIPPLLCVSSWHVLRLYYLYITLPSYWFAVHCMNVDTKIYVMYE